MPEIVAAGLTVQGFRFTVEKSRVSVLEFLLKLESAGRDRSGGA